MTYTAVYVLIQQLKWISRNSFTYVIMYIPNMYVLKCYRKILHIIQWLQDLQIDL